MGANLRVRLHVLISAVENAISGDAFRPGDILAVKKSPNCAAIMHAEKLLEDDEQVICLTVIPIAYGPYRIGDDLTFGIEPPSEVRPAAGFPVFKP